MVEIEKNTSTGLGRTGVLIACYLAYSLRVRANDAIRFVRLKRPNAVQTRGQILCVQQFEQFIIPQSIVYCNKEFVKDRKINEFSLTQYLNRQRIMLHGYEARNLQHIPKIIYVLCERLLRLSNCQHHHSEYGLLYEITSLPFTRCFVITKVNAQKESRTRFLHSNSDPTNSIMGSPYPSTAPSAVSTRTCNSDLAGLPGSRETISDTTVDYDDDKDVAIAPIVSCSSPDMPSCASGMSELDDGCLDSMLGDGICGQELHQNICYQELKENSQEDAFTPCSVSHLVEVLLADHTQLSEAIQTCIKKFRVDLNNRQSTWTRLQLETNIYVLSGLIYDWLEHLKAPILSRDDLCYIVILADNPQDCLRKLDLASQYTIEYLLRFIARLDTISQETRLDLIARFIASLTHQAVIIQDKIYPSGKGYPRLRRGTFKTLMGFMTTLFDMILETIPSASNICESPEASVSGSHS